MTDEEKERIAIQVEHLPPDEAQAEYDRLTNHDYTRQTPITSNG